MTSDLEGAAAQLRRVLLALPKLDDDQAHSLKALAATAGTDEQTLLRDLHALVDRNGEEPAGFLDSVSLAVDATSVRLQAPGFFRRPMGLSANELHALELGLATLRLESPPDECASIDRARTRLHLAITGLPVEPIDDRAYAARAGAEGDESRAIRKLLQQCIASHHVAEISYQKASDTAPAWRRVRPIGFVFARGSWYLVAFAVEADEVRVFRFDRISEARKTKNAFAPLDSFRLTDVVGDGRVLASDPDNVIRVRYSATIARWIAEREGVPLADDGSVTIDHPLADTAWAIRHVLQYGTEAEVIEPGSIREEIRAVLQRLIADVA